MSDGTGGRSPLVHSALVNGNGALSEESSHEIVPFWSFTKTLIAACAVAMVAEQKLDLDAQLPGKLFTLRQLLQHRAGLTDYGGLSAYHEAVERDDEPWSDEELIARTGAENLMFAPGSNFAYSNIGYLFARRHIEQIAQRTLGDALARYVFTPLGLRDCMVATRREDMRATVFGVNQSYHPGWVYHGLVIGPVSQAALALHLLLTTSWIPTPLREQMLAGQFVGENIPDRPWTRAEYGLGLMTGEWGKVAPPARMLGDDASAIDQQSLSVAGHSAGGPGSSGAVYRSSTHPVTVAVFSNATDAAPPEWEARCLMLARRVQLE